MSDEQTARREVSRDELAEQLRTLGVERGGVLLVHTSFRAVRPIEGGPVGLIAALRAVLGLDGTLVMPSWTGDDEEPFDPATTPAAADLGVVADAFWRLPGVARSEHPFAFAAAGPQAARVTSHALPLPPHRSDSPVGRVYELNGQVLLLGVAHDADTTLHLAEVLARVPYRVPKHCTIFQGGRPVRVDYWENDHCCDRFGLADEWLRGRGLQAEARVGHAHARLFRARDVVNVALSYLEKNSLLFLHEPPAGCAECDAARRSASRKADRWVERRKTSDFKSIVCRRRRRSGAWLRLSRAETISIEKLAGWVAGPLLNRLGRQVASRVWRTDSGKQRAAALYGARHRSPDRPVNIPP